MIFGNWRPGGLAAGAALFGYTDALQLRRGSESVHALLLFIAVVLVAIGVFQFARGGRTVGLASVVIAVLAAVWYATTDLIPVEFVQAMPYVITLVVLALASQRLRPPAADGQPYRKGERLACADDGQPGAHCGLAGAAGRGDRCDAPRLRAVLELPGRRGGAGRRRPHRGRLQRGERVATASGCAPSAAWSRRCTRPAAAGSSHCPVWTVPANR